MNEKRADWINYGGRGIHVCDRWHKFENFRDDVGDHPGKGWTLDRLRVNEDYGPDNWQWAVTKTQNRNKRTTKLTEEQAKKIRARALAGETQRKLGQEFGIYQSEVSYIVQNKLWI